MLPGMGGFEAVIIALLALVIVGPKDLPILMRKLARWVNKVRGMAAEFRMSFDELARQSELDELRREVEALRRGDPLHPVRAELDPVAREINSGLNDHPSVTDRDHTAYEAAVAEANGEAAAAADPYTPSFESTPPPAPSPAPVEAAPAAVPQPGPEPEPAPPAAAETPAPAAKRARRKAKVASVAGGEA
jgi:sec-independent protein translocase protein TatB